MREVPVVRVKLKLQDKYILLLLLLLLLQLLLLQLLLLQLLLLQNLWCICCCCCCAGDLQRNLTEELAEARADLKTFRLCSSSSSSSRCSSRSRSKSSSSSSRHKQRLIQRNVLKGAETEAMRTL